MPLIIEDGTRVSDANSYIDIAAADQYWAARGNTDWDALGDPEKEAHLVAGFDYVNNTMIHVYSGTLLAAPVNTASWPRKDAVYWRGGPAIEIDAIPLEVQQAQIIAADLSRAGTLPTQTYTPPQSGASGAVKKEKVDVLEVEYFEAAVSGATPEAEKVDQLSHPDVMGVLRPVLDEGHYEDLNHGRVNLRASGALVVSDRPRAFLRGDFSNPRTSSLPGGRTALGVKVY